MKNQLQTAITQRDRAVQVALNFVGHHISSSDGSYEMLIECVHQAMNEAAAKAVSEFAADLKSYSNRSHKCQCSACDPSFNTLI